ncbi:MAG: glucose-6-phosphate isomerase [Lachnospiraceae bacterium]|nr:glucose-6-phosphate isomerase [Lachnospiraceae bacterium]
MPFALSLKNAENFIDKADFEKLLPLAALFNKTLEDKSGEGSNYIGWIDYPEAYDKEEFQRIKQCSDKIISDSEVFIVIGIGGSYLGAAASIDFIKSALYNNLSKKTPDIYFVGNNISSDYISDIINILGDREFSINVISKSGTTIEPAITFRIFRELIEKKYGEEEASKRIYVTTDKSKGVLKALSDEKGYKTFVIPDDIGGRYSVLTSVGLLPMAVAGIDIDLVMQGALAAYKDNRPGLKGYAEKYAVMRNCLMKSGKEIEILVSYEPYLKMFGEWYKQLFGESEGKGKKGIYPSSLIFSTDLHSMGQFIQDGSRNIFETVLWFKEARSEIKLKKSKEDIDGLNYLSGENISHINQKAFEGSLLAHVDGGAPNIIMEIGKRDEYHLGYLIYFFEKACGISGYILGVNPFDQPGVESYKKNMFALLGKKGYEAERENLLKRL